VFNASFDQKAKFPAIDLGSKEFQILQRKDLVMNVFRDGQWGSFRHLPAFKGHCNITTVQYMIIEDRSITVLVINLQEMIADRSKLYM
jgi:hypothetical protein